MELWSCSCSFWPHHLTCMQGWCQTISMCMARIQALLAPSVVLLLVWMMREFRRRRCRMIHRRTTALDVVACSGRHRAMALAISHMLLQTMGFWNSSHSALLCPDNNQTIIATAHTISRTCLITKVRASAQEKYAVDHFLFHELYWGCDYMQMSWCTS